MRPRFQRIAPFSAALIRLARLKHRAIAPMIAVAARSACSGDLAAPSEEAPAEPVAEAESAITLAQPVRLALEVDNGVGVPLQVRAGQTFYLNQIDLRASYDCASPTSCAGASHFRKRPWSCR